MKYSYWYSQLQNKHLDLNTLDLITRLTLFCEPLGMPTCFYYQLFSTLEAWVRSGSQKRMKIPWIYLHTLQLLVLKFANGGFGWKNKVLGWENFSKIKKRLWYYRESEFLEWYSYIVAVHHAMILMFVTRRKQFYNRYIGLSYIHG